MPFTYSAFRVKNLSHLIKMTHLEKKLDKILRKVEIDKFQLGKLLVQFKQCRSETFQHCLNVANLTYHLAKEIELDEKEIIEVSLGALFHDVGKIFVDLNILDKTGKLSKDEWKIIKKHPHFGVKLLSKHCCSESIFYPVLYHHERIDGLGYEGLLGSQIPLGAKIISLADSFDAMMSNRPYRTKLIYNKCLEEVEVNSGTQFDPDLTKYFMRIIEKIQEI